MWFQNKGLTSHEQILLYQTSGKPYVTMTGKGREPQAGSDTHTFQSNQNRYISWD